MKPTITLHASVCDATPGMCAHDWQCQRTCPGKPARYSAQGKHADTLRQRIQAQHGLPPHHAADPQGNAPTTTQASDEDTDRATAPVPSADEAFAGIAAIVTAVLSLAAIGSLFAAWQCIAPHLR